MSNPLLERILTQQILHSQRRPIVVQGQAPTQLTATGCVLGATVVANGHSVTAVAVALRLASDPDWTAQQTFLCVLTGGTHAATLTDLTPAASYLWRPFATDSTGHATTGPVLAFSTPPLPTLTTDAVTAILGTTATAGGSVLSSLSPPSARGVTYGEFSLPTLATALFTNDGTGPGAFISSLTALDPDKTYYVRAYATSAEGTGYGPEVTFTTLPPPTVTTGVVSDLGPFGATVAGAFVTTVGDPATYGVAYATSPNPTLFSDHTTEGSGPSGTFSSVLTWLTAGTTYYARAYAFNSAGVTYGVDVSFTTLPQPASSAIVVPITVFDDTSASVDGSYSNPALLNVTGSGVVYSAVEMDPTKADSVVSNVAGSPTTLFTYTLPLTELSPTTTYYVRTYVEVDGVATYHVGPSAVLLTLATATTTAPASSITQTSATVAGTYAGTGVTESGVAYSTSTGPLAAGPKVVNAGGASFSLVLPSLTAYTTYYARAYAQTTAGVAYGQEVVFQTLPALAAVTTAAVSAVTVNSATTGGSFTGDAVLSSGVVYSLTDPPTLADTVEPNFSNSSPFGSNLVGLLETTTYYVRAYASNVSGTSYGASLSFTTL